MLPGNFPVKEFAARSNTLRPVNLVTLNGRLEIN